jgi:murein DD-endopeptidase MepM/ murein hydrolase activator NlpD
MGLNPFKDSNLNDLQRNITQFFFDNFGALSNRLKEWWYRVVKKGKEKLTVMFIPHSEKKIINFHISIFAIFIIVSIVITTVTITSVVIINHTSTIKEVSRLKFYGTNSKLQIKKYRDEINRLYDIFQKFKPEITHLYSLTPENDVDSLWAKGGMNNPEVKYEDEDDGTPPIEVLNIQEVEKELKTTKEILTKIKSFLETRKKILGNTPSLWPVDGYIISRFGEGSYPHGLKKEQHKGIDIAAFPGTEIRATAPGRIESISWNTVLGLTVTIKHKYGFITSYSHCQRVSVEVNQMVSKGEVIGYVGRTGKAARHMCFYQVKIGTEFIDPIPYLNRLIR